VFAFARRHVPGDVGFAHVGRVDRGIAVLRKLFDDRDQRRTDVDLKVHSSEDRAESPVFVRTDARKRERVVVDEFAREIDEFVFLDNGVLSGHW
jgi:hypothetical protein